LRVPIRIGAALLLSLFASLFASAAAASAATGGTVASEPSPSPTSTTAAGGASPSSPTTTKTPAHYAPVTGHSLKLIYKGPVYEKLATGQVVPYAAPTAPEQVAPTTGGSPVGSVADTETKPQLLVPGSTARVVGGLAAAPLSAPADVQEIIWAGNQIVGLPYIYGGGHASFTAPGYDCSGTVSFALHGASLLTAPMDSSEFMSWGGTGVGEWVTVFTNPGHAYMTVAGLRLDTSAVDDPTNQQGPRWRPLRPSNPGFTVRHPIGL
jgi:hypothetical protein